ncbi:MAG: ComEA family DNA-binding protein, partial [Rhodococcus sp. (in: high G+C Gram-positive bacteria)]
MGIGEERSRVRTRLAFITSGERRILPTEMLTPPSPEWLTSTRDDEAVDDTTWSAESSWYSGWLPERWRGARLGAGRSGAIVLVLVGIVVVGVTVVAVGRDQPVAHAVPSLPAVDEGAPAPAVGEAASPVPAPPPAPPPADEEMVVSVVGLVVSAGLVTLPPG